MKILDPATIAAKNRLENLTPWIILLDLHPSANEVIYLCNDNAPVEWNDRTYTPIPFTIDQIKASGDGSLNGTQISVDNTQLVLSEYIDRSRGFVGNRVVIRLYHDGVADIQQSFKVQDATVTEKAAAFAIGNEDLLKTEFPAGRYNRDRCIWAYRGAICAYSGPLVTCDRGLRTGNGCEAHANFPRFGGAPGIIRVG